MVILPIRPVLLGPVLTYRGNHGTVFLPKSAINAAIESALAQSHLAERPDFTDAASPLSEPVSTLERADAEARGLCVA